MKMWWIGVILVINVAVNNVKCTCLFTSTGESLADCQWSSWCWDCSVCFGQDGIVVKVRGTCCGTPNDDPNKCATNCNITSITDIDMATTSSCFVQCNDTTGPSVCKSLTGNNKIVTTAPATKHSLSTPQPSLSTVSTGVTTDIYITQMSSEIKASATITPSLSYNSTSADSASSVASITLTLQPSQIDRSSSSPVATLTSETFISTAIQLSPSSARSLTPALQSSANPVLTTEVHYTTGASTAHVFSSALTSSVSFSVTESTSVRVPSTDRNIPGRNVSGHTTHGGTDGAELNNALTTGNLAPIVGGAAGGVIVMTLVVVMVIYVLKRQKARVRVDSYGGARYEDN